MDRRELMLGAAATVIAASVPGLAAAEVSAPEPKTQIGRKVDLALNTLDRYGFTIHEQTNVFGLIPNEPLTKEGLREGVFHLASFFRDTLSRVDFVLTIRRELENRCGPENLYFQRAWLCRPNLRLELMGSPRYLMTSSRYMDLYRVAAYLESTRPI